MARLATRAVATPDRVRSAIEHFIAHARRPALLEPGEPLLFLTAENFSVEERSGRVSLNAWDQTRNLMRRVNGIARQERGRLVLNVHRFGARSGETHLLDLAHPRNEEQERKGSRMIFRERLRCMLEREFVGWRIAQISSDPDLEHSLSPAFPRALLIKGRQAVAAIGAPPEANGFPAMLTFGLIWLDYVRRMHPALSVSTLAFWAPSPVAPALSFYLPHFDAAKARFAMYLYSDEDFSVLLDPRNYGNVSTGLDVCHLPADMPFSVKHAETMELANGEISLRVAGLEFARYGNGKLGNGRAALTPDEANQIAGSLHAMRNADADRQAPIWQQNPEAWLEAVVRKRVSDLDASLLPAPVYGQVPAIAGHNRTVIDLLAVDRSSRLTVLELKAAQDLHLPLQALDYWLRVKWHLDRDEFGRFGYFPGRELHRAPPRLLLVAPALAFHPSTETVLQFFAPEIDVMRIGLSADWRKSLRIMFRLPGAQRPV